MPAVIYPLAMKHPRVVPTRAQLERAFNKYQDNNLPDWPATLDEALADRGMRALLHGRAVGLARQEARQARAVPPQFKPFTRPPAALRIGRAQGVAFDPKKAAANDTDD